MVARILDENLLPVRPADIDRVIVRDLDDEEEVAGVRRDLMVRESDGHQPRRGGCADADDAVAAADIDRAVRLIHVNRTDLPDLAGGDGPPGSQSALFPAFNLPGRP